METKKRISELLGLLTNGLFDRGPIFELAFLSVFTEQSTYIFGRSGSGKNIIAKRLVQAFRDPNVLTFGKRQQEIPNEFNDYQIVLFQGFDSKSPICSSFVNIALQEKAGRSLLMISKDRPEVALNRAGVGDQILFVLSLPEVYSVDALHQLLKENLNVKNLVVPSELQISKEEQEAWLKEIEAVELADESLNMITQIAEACNESHIYVSIQKWLAFGLITKTIAYFNGRKKTNITDTFFLGTPIWIRRAQNESVTASFKENLVLWLKQKNPVASELDLSINQIKLEVERTLNANGDVYETVMFNDVECIQYSITVAGESVPLYAPASYIGTNEEFNPFNELKQKEKRVICSFMGDNVCRISIDSFAKRSGLRAKANSETGKTFEPFAKLPARILRINDEEKIKRNKEKLTKLKDLILSVVEKNANALVEFKELYKDVKANRHNLFLNKDYFNFIQEAIQAEFAEISEQIQVLKTLQDSLIQKQ